MIRTIIQRLTTDVGALRLENATLSAAVSKAIEERQHAQAMADHYKAEADAFHRLHDRAVDERDRLRALAGNTEATPAERAVLDVVATMPGAMAKDIGRAVWQVYADSARAEWAAENPGKDPPSHHWYVRECCDFDALGNARPLSSLHNKGLVRRERAGQSYRYWPVGGGE